MISIAEKTATQETPYIIAEIGSNYTKLSDCLESIKISKMAGADCVKFQLFDFKSLYGLRAEDIPPWYNKKYELPMDWLPQIKEQCNDSSIHLMLSTFNPDMPRHVNHFIESHKVASSEITNIDLLESVASLGKPVFVSTGGASIGDIELAMSILKGCKVILNYCVGSYPAKSTNLYILDQLSDKFGVPVGFSDHSRDFCYLPMSAVRNHGAISVEKHINPMGVSSPDSPHSLTPAQFMTMADYLKGFKAPMIGPSSEEADMIMRHKRRLVATTKIPAGKVLSWGDNFGAYRVISPETDFLTPFYKDKVDGQKAKRDIMPGKAITSLDF